MPTFTSKPNADSNFFDNYHNHCMFVMKKNEKIFEAEGDFTAKKNESFAKLNFFTPLRDRYDFTDELLGATLLPLAGVVCSVAVTVLAIKDLFHALAITIDLVKDDDENHGEQALHSFVGALFIAVLSLAALIKCAISLLTRPIATLGNAIFNSTPENSGGADQSQLEEEKRFMVQ